MGPLVVAGILIEKDRIEQLEKLQVKDSKLLTPKVREKLEPRIKKVVRNYDYSVLTVRSIDHAVEKGKKLNFLEAKAMGMIISRLKPDITYVDAVDPIAERFALRIRQMAYSKGKVFAEHKADIKYPVVSAASILAKVKRDRLISRLRKKYGNLGSGYPSDLRTRKFLEQWIREFGKAPSFARKSWITVKRFEKCKY